LKVFVFNLYSAVTYPAEVTCGQTCLLGERHEVFCFSRKESAPERAWCLGPGKEGGWDFPSWHKQDKEHCIRILLHSTVHMLWKIFFMYWD